MYAYRTPEMLVSVKYKVIARRCALVGIFSSDQGKHRYIFYKWCIFLPYKVHEYFLNSAEAQLHKNPIFLVKLSLNGKFSHFSQIYEQNYNF